jgi:Zn-dependent metalloprotease
MEKPNEDKKENKPETVAVRKCGMSGTLPFSSGLGLLTVDVPKGFSVSTGAGYVTTEIWTSYGKASVPAYSFGPNSDFLALQNSVTGLDGKPIFIKCVDAVANSIGQQMNLSQLANMPATVINKTLNERYGKEVAEMKGRNATNKDMSSQLAALGPTDVHWLTNEYLEFLHIKLKLNNINSDGLLLSVHNVKNLDNAFFTGDYMVYGDGGRTFVEMGKADVIAHELGHGIVKSTANLEYKGHSGALNEHMSDVLGVCFEFWLYNKYNKNESKSDDISGRSDWLIGEDVGKEIPYLRSMRDPENAASPQPSVYKGRFWSDPNNMDLDLGGVHINSGVPNKCFFLAAKKIGLFRTLKTWFRALNKLTTHSNFMDFRDTIKSCTKPKHMDSIIEALNDVGLTTEALSDWVV